MPGLGFAQAIRGSTRLQAVGFSAGEAENTLTQFGNALARVGGGKKELDGVITALSQIVSKGKVSAEEINQIAERVPEIRTAIEAAFGTSDTEAIQDLGLESQEFIQGVVKELEKLPRATGGLKNEFENLSDDIAKAMDNIGTSISDVFGAAFDTASGIIEGFLNVWNGIPTAFQEAIAFGAAMVPVIAGVAAAFFALSSPITLIIVGLTALGGLIFFVAKNFNNLKLIAEGVLDIIVAQLAKVLNKLAKMIQSYLNLVEKAVNAARGVVGLDDIDITGEIDGIVAGLAAVEQQSINGQRKIANGWAQITKSIESTIETAKQAGKEFAGITPPDLSGGAGTGKQKNFGLEGLSAIDIGRLDLDIRKVAEAQEELEKSGVPTARALSEVNSVVGDGARKLALYDSKMKEVDGSAAAVGETLSAFGVQMAFIKEGVINTLIQGFETLRYSIGNAFASAITDGKNFLDSIKRILKQVIEQIIAVVAQAAILAGIFSLVGGGGVGFGKAFSFFAGGGSISGGIDEFLRQNTTGGRNVNVNLSGQFGISGNNLQLSIQETQRIGNRRTAGRNVFNG